MEETTASSSSSPPRAGGRKRRLSSMSSAGGGGGGLAAAAAAGDLALLYPMPPGLFDRVASRRLRPQGQDWVLEAEGVRAYLPSLLRLLRDADESKVVSALNATF